MKQPLIQFINVHKRFGDLPVLDGLNLSIYKGQVTTVIGRRGAGKSVLLNHIAGLMDPDSGRILWSGRGITDRETYQVTSGDASSTDSKKRQAVEKLLKRLSETVYQRITDDF